MKFTFVKWPFLFWITVDRDGHFIDADTIEVKNHRLNIKPLNKMIYISLYHLPAVIFLIITFNRYDFDITQTTKLLQWISAAIAAGVLFAGYKKAALPMILLTSISGALITNDFTVISYSIKYFIAFFILGKLLNSVIYGKRIYNVFQDGRIVTQLIDYKNKEKETGHEQI